MGKKTVKIQWFDEPEAHNYPATQSCLSLMFAPPIAAIYVTALRQAAVTEFKPKEMFRASGHSLLGVSNDHGVRDQKKTEATRAYRRFCWFGMGSTDG